MFSHGGDVPATAVGVAGLAGGAPGPGDRESPRVRARGDSRHATGEVCAVPRGSGLGTRGRRRHTHTYILYCTTVLCTHDQLASAHTHPTIASQLYLAEITLSTVLPYHWRLTGARSRTSCVLRAHGELYASLLSVAVSGTGEIDARSDELGTSAIEWRRRCGAGRSAATAFGK